MSVNLSLTLSLTPSSGTAVLWALHLFLGQVSQDERGNQWDKPLLSAK